MDAMSEPLRLVYLVSCFPKLSETFVLNELRELTRLGDDVTIVAQGPPDASEPRPAAGTARRGGRLGVA
jgi:hypothetical protein